MRLVALEVARLVVEVRLAQVHLVGVHRLPRRIPGHPRRGSKYSYRYVFFGVWFVFQCADSFSLFVIKQLQDMGFTNAQQNVRALLATGGNVHSAIEYILGGGGI